MLKQLQHTRFIVMSVLRHEQYEQLSYGCYWYALADHSIEPIGNSNDSIHKRPDYVHAGT